MAVGLWIVRTALGNSSPERNHTKNIRHCDWRHRGAVPAFRRRSNDRGNDQWRYDGERRANQTQLDIGYSDFTDLWSWLFARPPWREQGRRGNGKIR